MEISANQWPRKQATEREILRAGLEFAGNPELRRKVFENIRAGAIDGRRDGAVLNSHFRFRSYLQLPFLFREAIAKGKEALESEVKGAVLAFNAESALPDLVTRNYQSFRSYSNYDFRCFESFRRMEFEPGRKKLEIPKINGGIKIQKRKPGQPVELSTFDGTSDEIEAIYYGGGLQWDISMLENRDFNGMMNLAELFNDSVAEFQTSEVYKVIVGTAQANTPTAHIATGASAHENGILTINKGCEDLALDVKDEVGVDAAMAELLLYCNAGDSRVSRVKAMLNYTTIINPAASATAITQRPIRLLPTYNLRQPNGTALNAKYGILVLAGRQSVYGDKLLPTTYSGQDIFTFSQAQTVDLAFAVGCKNIKQVRLVEIFAS